MFIGDLNYDLLTADRCTPLQNVCDLENIIKGPTCFTKGASPTLNDVILTNSKNLLQNITNFNCGLSDVHNIISAQIKSNIPPIKEQFKQYRSYKQLNEEEFIKDLNQANISNKIDQENDINAAYNYFQTKVTTVIDQHIPMKKRKNREKQAPFMNNQLRHAIYKKSMLHNQYLKTKSNKNWECYRVQRNYVNKLKRQSIRHYFIERCFGGPKQKDFWRTLKPFLTNKGSFFENNIVLCNENQIINNQNNP